MTKISECGAGVPPKAGFDGDAIVNDAKVNIDDYSAAIATDTEQAIAETCLAHRHLLLMVRFLGPRSPECWIGIIQSLGHPPHILSVQCLSEAVPGGFYRALRGLNQKTLYV